MADIDWSDVYRLHEADDAMGSFKITYCFPVVSSSDTPVKPRKQWIGTKQRRFINAQFRRRAAAAAVVTCILEENLCQRRRSMWKKPFLQLHDSQGAFKNLVRELGTEDRPSYINFMRMDPSQFDELANRIRPLVTRLDTNFHKAISTEERLAVTLRFLATGQSYKSLSYMFRLGSTTVGKIVPETCKAIYEVLKDEYLKMPESPEEWEAVAGKFLEKWNFPNTLGAIDGKHIAMMAPAKSGSVYYNYKHFFSIVLMALVDADYKFIYVDVGCNGRVSDGGVFAGCTLAEALEKRLMNIPTCSELPGSHGLMSFHIVGDEAFPLKDYLMKPFPFRNMTREQRIFNYRLSRARRVVENAFGILCSRFRVLLNRMYLNPDKAEAVVLCCCALHNYLLSGKDTGCYMGSGVIDSEDSVSHELVEGSWRRGASLHSCGIPHSNFSGFEPKEKRERLMRFCSSEEGMVSWQDSILEKELK